MQDNGLINKILNYLDEHQWISFLIGTASILLAAYVALRFGHGLSEVLGTVVLD